MASGAAVFLDEIVAVRYMFSMSAPASSDSAGSTGRDTSLPRRILVPTDFSATSERALDYALELGKKLTASVKLCHCALQPDYELADLVSPGMRTAASALIEKAMAMADAAHAELDGLASRKRSEGVVITTAMLSGRPADAIVAAARQWGANLIVIGSRSRPGVRHVLLGSVAEKVVRAASCPVLVVHPDDRSGS